VRLKLSDLFEGLGYSARCAALSGAEVEIAGWIADSHDGRLQLLVAEPGGCPHCSPEPVPAITLPGFRMNTGDKPVNLRGTLSYGFALDASGNASFLRLENARVATGLPT
jgi:hypothetical protein